MVSGHAAHHRNSLRGLFFLDVGGSRVRVIPAARLPDRGESYLELVALGRLEPLEELLLYLVHHLGGLVDDRQSLLRDFHDVTAAILRIAAPGGEAAFLELVQ